MATVIDFKTLGSDLQGKPMVGFREAEASVSAKRGLPKTSQAKCGFIKPGKSTMAKAGVIKDGSRECQP